MADLKEFQVDTRAIADGVWIEVNPAAYGDLEILSRGFTDEFVDAQNRKMTNAAEQYSGDRAQITNSQLRSINASLLEDYLVVNVRNLTSSGQPVPVEDFHSMLYKPEFHRLARACWEAAARVTTRSVAQIETAKGNSPARSESGSAGANSESV